MSVRFEKLWVKKGKFQSYFIPSINFLSSCWLKRNFPAPESRKLWDSNAANTRVLPGKSGEVNPGERGPGWLFSSLLSEYFLTSLTRPEQERSLVRSLAENAYPSLAAYLPHLAIPSNPFMPKPEAAHPFFLSPASSFHFSSLFSGDLGKPGRRRKARTVFSDAQLAGLERRWENKKKSFDILQV